MLELGFGRGAVTHRLASGWLHPLHSGVYAVGHPAITSRGRWMAAVLACGPDAMLSHRSAAALWGLRASNAIVEVTAPGRRRGRAGVVVHRVRTPDPDDRTLRERIPVTSVPRTLLDLAEVLRPQQLERAIEEAERLRLFDGRAVRQLRERSRGRIGLRRLGAVLSRDPLNAAETRSELERRFLALCRDAGLPAPAVNTIVAGYEVDAVWPDQRLVVELDGHAFHRTRAAFERDRIRDAALQLAGFRVLRFTYRRIEAEPTAVVESVRSLLAS